MGAKKNIRMAYYAEWDGEQHLTAFGKHLNDNQVRIEQFYITISNKDKLQYYLKQMYASNHFDKKEMAEWENKPEATKDGFNEVKIYFEGLVREYRVYTQNNGGTASKHNFESANQTAKANHSNKLCQYYVGIAQAAVNQKEQAVNIRNSMKASMDAVAAQIKAMSDQIAHITKAMANKENVLNGGGGGTSGGHGGKRDNGQTKRKPTQYTKLCSMGCYCWLEGFHPAGANHTSANCK